MNVTYPLPNQYTPMAFLPPKVARETRSGSYIVVGSAAVFIWDLIENLYGDYRILFKHRIGLPTVAYFVSRIGTLASIICSALFLTAPTGNCDAFEKALDSIYPIAVPASSLLFFFRVRAIYDKNKHIVTIFFILWILVVASCLTHPIAVTGINIGTTMYCLNAKVQPYVGIAGIVPMIHDTSVFVAITWRLMQNSEVEFNLKRGLRIVLFGDYLPHFSKALLQDGQMYYLVTVLSNILAVTMVYVSMVPTTFRTMFANPNIVLVNIMACRVYRNTLFDIYREGAISTTAMLSAQGKTPSTNESIAFRTLSESSGSTTPRSNMSDTMELPVVNPDSRPRSLASVEHPQRAHIQETSRYSMHTI